MTAGSAAAPTSWTVDPARLIPGTRFDTPFESGCVVWSSPDELGEFLAHDSDNVLCAYSVVMVTQLQEVRP